MKTYKMYEKKQKNRTNCTKMANKYVQSVQNMIIFILEVNN